MLTKGVNLEVNQLVCCAVCRTGDGLAFDGALGVSVRLARSTRCSRVSKRCPVYLYAWLRTRRNSARLCSLLMGHVPEQSSARLPRSAQKSRAFFSGSAPPCDVSFRSNLFSRSALKLTTPLAPDWQAAINPVVKMLRTPEEQRSDGLVAKACKY